MALSVTPTVFLADIGGTNSRFAVLGADGRPDRIHLIRKHQAPDFAAAVAHFLAKTGVHPQAGVLALAGPVSGDLITLTNRSWQFRLSEIATQFGMAELRALNDFEAVAWSLPGLDADDTRPIGPVSMTGVGARVVCGPGTGLGVAALVPQDEFWRVVPSEAGHISFGPASAHEEPVFARLRKIAGPVSAEAVLSGPGLTRLHQALHRQDTALRPEDIIGQAKSGEARAKETAALFVRLLGRFAGDITLAFRATGAVYLAGGVGFAIAPLIEPQEFRHAFEAHRPYEELLATVPTLLMRDPEPGLMGCAVYARRMFAGH